MAQSLELRSAVIGSPLYKFPYAGDYLQQSKLNLLPTPAGLHTEFTGTVINRAYDWLPLNFTLSGLPEPLPIGETTVEAMALTGTRVDRSSDWMVPPILINLIQIFPYGKNTLFAIGLTGTLISRAYDWLVTQYSMIAPVTPPPPVFTGTPGHVIPNYFYNAPGGKFGKGY